MKFLPIFLGIIYFIFPRDIIPDFLGPIGRLDDILILGFIWWKNRHLFQSAQAESTKPQFNQEKKSEFSTNGVNSKLDPYEILGLKHGATQEEVDSHYRNLASKYHPDKVQHLGKELQDLAHEKMIQIQNAYEALKST